MPEEILKIPCVLSRLTSLRDGGWSVTYHVGQSSAKEIRELIGTENNTPYVMMLVKLDKNSVCQE